MDDIQSTLEQLAAHNDHRTSVFDIAIERLQQSRLTLSGRLLDESQLAMLVSEFPKLNLDTTSVRLLHRENLPRRYVKTNLTGLYERPTFGMPLASELYFGTELEVLDEQPSWVFTRQNDGYLGWAYKSYLVEDAPAQATHLVLAPSSELRAQPHPESEIVTRLVSGTGVRVEDVQGDWARVSANATGWLAATLLRPVDQLPETLEDKQKTLVDDAPRMIGVPYLWGGSSGNGIDCSGLTRLLHRWVGIAIPRDADLQHAAAAPVELPFEAGDLLFFAESGSDRKITHVGMSLGGWKVVHASRARNGVYVEDVRENERLMRAFVSSGSFLR